MRGCIPLTDLQVESVLVHLISPRDRLLFIMGVKTGLRISELLSLRVEQVFRNNTVLTRIDIPRSSLKRKGSGRSMPLHFTVQKAIRTLATSAPLSPHTPLFASAHNPYKAISRVQAYRILKHAMALALVQGRTGTHSMRKTFAMNVYERLNRDLLRTRVALGHKNIDSTISYLSFDQKDIDQAILHEY